MEKIKNWIEDAKRICLVTHTDTDGVCSGALFLKAAKQITNKGIDIRMASTTILGQEGFYNKLPNADLFVFTDLGVDQAWEMASREIGNKRMVIMDHHIPSRNLNSSRIIHINPRFDRDVYYPASKIVFDIFSKITNINDLDWMALVGIIGDMGVPDTKAFVKKTLDKYGMKSRQKDARDTSFARIDELIGSAMVCRGSKGAMESLEQLEKANNYKEVLENKKLQAYREKVENYLDELKKDFQKNAEHFKQVDCLMYEITPKYNIGSVLSTVLSKKIENKTIIIINRKGESMNLNFRRQDGRVNMKKLAEVSTKGIGTGGGHEKAAGGRIPSSKLDEFKIRAVSYLMLESKK